MPSPRREYREVTVDTTRSSGRSSDPLCCGVRQDGSNQKDKEGFSRLAVLYFVCFSCVFVVAVIGLRMFSIEDKLLRLDTDYQQQQMRIEALEEMMHNMRKVSGVFMIFLSASRGLTPGLLAMTVLHLGFYE